MWGKIKRDLAGSCVHLEESPQDAEIGMSISTGYMNGRILGAGCMHSRLLHLTYLARLWSSENVDILE